MKYEINGQEPPKKFEPVEVSFTIETKRELEFFLSYFNASGINQVEYANKNKPYFIKEDFGTDDCFTEMWDYWKELKDIYSKLD